MYYSRERIETFLTQFVFQQYELLFILYFEDGYFVNHCWLPNGSFLGWGAVTLRMKIGLFGRGCGEGGWWHGEGHGGQLLMTNPVWGFGPLELGDLAVSPGELSSGGWCPDVKMKINLLGRKSKQASLN